MMRSPLIKPINTIFFIIFVSLPEIRFTDRGIVDVKIDATFPLFV